MGNDAIVHRLSPQLVVCRLFSQRVATASPALATCQADKTNKVRAPGSPRRWPRVCQPSTRCSALSFHFSSAMRSEDTCWRIIGRKAVIVHARFTIPENQMPPTALTEVEFPVVASEAA